MSSREFRTSKSSLFLMELILAILFFSLAAAICVQMFVKGHNLSRDSVKLNHAVVYCENMAEAFYSMDGDLEAAAKILGGTLDGNKIIVKYAPVKTDSANADSMNADSKDAIHTSTEDTANGNFVQNTDISDSYYVTGTLSVDGRMLILDISCYFKEINDSNYIYGITPELFPKVNHPI